MSGIGIYIQGVRKLGLEYLGRLYRTYQKTQKADFVSNEKGLQSLPSETLVKLAPQSGLVRRGGQ